MSMTLPLLEGANGIFGLGHTKSVPWVQISLKGLPVFICSRHGLPSAPPSCHSPRPRIRLSNLTWCNALSPEIRQASTPALDEDNSAQTVHSGLQGYMQGYRSPGPHMPCPKHEFHAKTARCIPTAGHATSLSPLPLTCLITPLHPTPWPPKAKST